MENTTETEVKKKKIGAVGLVATFILLSLNIFLAYSAALRSGYTEIGELVGFSIIGPIFFGLLVVAIFQIIAKYRNPKSRCTIFNWTLVLTLVQRIAEIYQDNGLGLQ